MSEPGQISLRFAVPGDLAVLVAVEARAFPDPWTRTMLQGELASAFGFQLLAFLGDGAPARPPVGYAAFRTDGIDAELLRLAVVPEARRRGVGRALVERGLARLAFEGIETCCLEVRRDNLPAIRLYESLGFVSIGERRAYYRDGTDALVFQRVVEAG